MYKCLAILAAVMLVVGCGGGGGGGSSFSSFFDSGSTGSSYVSGSGSSDFADLGHSPEPATLTLFGLGAAGLALASLRKRKR